MSDLSKRIKQAIVSSGKTQKEVAVNAGICEVTLSRYAGGRREPKVEVIPKIAKACGVSAEWLCFGKSGNMPHIEMIIDYVTDGEDFQYCDNHGILTRCRDCTEWHTDCMPVAGKHGCDKMHDYTEPDFYCGYARRRKDD